MPLKILQPSPCLKACAGCPHSVHTQPGCAGQSACLGYGSRPECPPLIVLAVHEWAMLAHSLVVPPAFASIREAHA